MQIKKFDIKVDKNKLIKGYEENINFIEPYDYTNRTTYIDYKNVPVIKYKIFDEFPDIITGFSTRLGGVSKNHLSSLNLSFTRGDDVNNVIENHIRLSKALGYDYKRLVFSNQVHDTKIHVINDDEDAGKGITKESDILEIDGLVTNKKNIPIITFYADCVPLFFYDKKEKVIGLAHSGWRGTVNNIAGEMIKKMQDNYNSNPENIVCAIGPSICKKCYEVDDIVIDKIKENYSQSEYERIVEEKDNGKYQLDLHMACKINLLNSLIPEKNIAMPDLCTCCNSNILYSHRASKGMRGNLAAVMMLK